MKTIIRGSTDRQRVVRQIAQLNPEKVWQIDIKEYKRNRSKDQNALYWKWLSVMGDELGYTKEELHAVFADKFLGLQEVVAFGKRLTHVPSTSSLNVHEFTEYLEKIERFAATDLGMSLPSRDDLYFEAMYGARK